MVKLEIVWENEAKVKLRQLYQYIKRDVLQNALKVRNVIVEKIKRTAIYPEACTP